jgi:hypothetical protein
MNRFETVCLSSLWVLMGQAVLAEGPTSPAPDSGRTAATRAAVSRNYGSLPLSFELNRGQADPKVKFLARGQGYGLFLTPSEIVLSLRAVGAERPSSTADHSSRSSAAPAAARVRPGAVVHMRLAQANAHPQVSGVDLLPGTSNYFVGNDPDKWLRGVPSYAKVKLAQVYPGIDLLYYGNQRQLEYDFVLSPGASPASILLDFEGVERLSIDGAGNLVLATSTGDLLQHKPAVYQDIDGVRRVIDGRYELRGAHRASFRVASHDPTHTLVIDPTLAYSSYLGGTGTDGGIGIAVDGIGNAYVIGNTDGGFPTVGGVPPNTFGGGFCDAFVTKLNSAGTARIYSTYLGGNDSELNADFHFGIAVDGNGSAYVTGFTLSTNFPTTAGAYQTSGTAPGNVFVTKLNPAGTALVYSTLLGANTGSDGTGIAVDPLGNAYVTGRAYVGFPTTPGSFQPTFTSRSAAFVTKLNSIGTELIYSSLIGGGAYDMNAEDSVGYAIAVDPNGYAYITGVENSVDFPTTAGAYRTCTVGGNIPLFSSFVTRFNQSGSGLVYSSCLVVANLNAIAVDGGGKAYVTGYDNAGGLPTTAGAYQTTSGGGNDAVLAKFDTNLSGASSLAYSSYLGGAGNDIGTGLAIDGSGNAYITGSTSGSFPTTAGAAQTIYGGGAHDAFITKLNPNASGLAGLVYSTYLGGTGNDSGAGLALDGNGNVYITGQTDGGFPTSMGASQTIFGGVADAFVAKLAFAASAAPTKLAITGVNSGANPTAGSAFTVIVQAQDAGGTAQAVAAGTNVTLSLHSGTGAAGGTLTCTIPAGAMGCFVSGVTYSKAETGVSLTATRTSGDALAPGNSAPFTVNAPGSLTQLVISSVNAGVGPTSGVGFNVVVQGLNATSDPQNALTATGVTLSVNTGTGTLGGTVSCTISPGLSSCIVAGVTYSKAESGVVLTATRTSGDTPVPGYSAVFNVYSRVVITSVNGGVNPVAGTTFNVVAQIQQGAGVPLNVASDTSVVLALKSGTGLLSGPRVCTITAGTSSCSAPATYSQAESGVVVNATAFPPGSPQIGANSAPFTVDPNHATQLTLFPGPGFSPAVGVPFTLGVASLNANSIPQNVTLSTLITLTVHTGTGSLGGTLTCTIPAGSDFCGLQSVTYSKAEAGVSVTATASGGDSLTPVNSPPFTVHPAAAPTQLVFFPFSSPSVGVPFGVGLVSTDAGGTPQKVAASTNVTLSVHTGTGVLGGTLTCTIAAGSTLCQGITAATYSKAEAGVSFTATRTSGDALAAVNTPSLTVNPLPTKLGFFGGFGPAAGQAFSVIVQAEDGTSTAQNVVAATAVALTVGTGTGILSGPVSCTIPAGSNFCSISGVSYSKPEAGVVLTASRTSGDALAAGNTAPFTVTQSVPPVPSQLGIPSVNGGAFPSLGSPFNVVVQSQDGSGIPQSVAASTGVTLSLHTGTGVLGGTLTCSIAAGSNSCTVVGATYSKAESGVSLTATRTSGDTLSAGNSAAFTVTGAGPVARVFVSATGADANVCSTITTPCRTIAGAISQVDPGGEVIVVNSGSYGGATVSKAVTVNVPTGVVAFTGQAIVVTAGASDTVVLRGLTSKAATAGVGTGIQFTSGAAVRVEGCVINGWATGIDATGPGELLVLDTAIRNSTVAGVSVSNASGRGMVGRSRLEGNAIGVRVTAGAATVRDSVVAGQSGTGLVADGGNLSIEACVVANNGTGVTAGPGAGTVRIDRSTVTDNTTGLLKTGSGVLQSRGDNTVSGNGTDTSGTITGFAPR